MSTLYRRTIKVGTRQSQLALTQTEEAIESIKTLQSAKCLSFEIVPIKCLGDKLPNSSIQNIGGKGIFTEDIEEALSIFTIDLAVHSLKDLPTNIASDLVIGCLLPREDPRNVVVFKSAEYTHLSQLPPNSVVGTSSLRRRSFIRRNYPQLAVKDVRGNINMRLSKLYADSKVYDALILAAAGLKRLNLEGRIGQYLDDDPFYYTAGQGAIAIEMRRNDKNLIDLLRPLNCRSTVLECLAERVFLNSLNVGCSTPAGVYAKLGVTGLVLKGTVMNLDGSTEVSDSMEVDFTKDEECAEDVTFTSIAPVVDVAEMTKVASMALKLAQRILHNGGENIIIEIMLS